MESAWEAASAPSGVKSASQNFFRVSLADEKFCPSIANISTVRGYNRTAAEQGRHASTGALDLAPRTLCTDVPRGLGLQRSCLNRVSTSLNR